MADRHQSQSYPLRLPEDLKQKIEDAAREGGRSINGEITIRLAQSIEAPELATSRQLLRLAMEVDQANLDKMALILMVTELVHTVRVFGATLEPKLEPGPTLDLIREWTDSALQLQKEADDYMPDESDLGALDKMKDNILSKLANLKAMANRAVQESKARVAAVQAVNLPVRLFEEKLARGAQSSASTPAELPLNLFETEPMASAPQAATQLPLYEARGSHQEEQFVAGPSNKRVKPVKPKKVILVGNIGTDKEVRSSIAKIIRRNDPVEAKPKGPPAYTQLMPRKKTPR